MIHSDARLADLTCIQKVSHMGMLNKRTVEIP